MKREQGKVALKLIHVPDWATSALIWGLWSRNLAADGDRHRIVEITDDARRVERYDCAQDGPYPVILYFCESCGMPLETLFCDCECGIKYERAVSGEWTRILRVLVSKLPQAIIAAHNAEVFGDVRGRPRYDWTAPRDMKRQPSFYLPKLK